MTDTDSKQSIGKRICNVRKEAGMTQKQLASRLGIPYQSIGQWERGVRKPKIETLQAIADAIGVSLDYLLGNVTDPFFVLDNERIKADINSYEDEETSQPQSNSSHEVSDEDIKFALFDGSKEITDEMFEEVKMFARYVQEKRAKE